jgi:hypothetical protein
MVSTPTLYITATATIAPSVTAAQTIASLPSTPAQTNDPDRCQPSALQISSGANESAAHITIGITLRNTSQTACILSGLPQVALVDSNGNPLEIAYAYAANARPNAILVRPGETVVVSLQWANWCKPFPAGGIKIRLGLAGGETIEIESALPSAGACASSDQASTVTVSAFGYTP